jgi:aspartyl/asparaginyl-tRNA synthetase
MANKINESTIKYIISRVLDNARDALEEKQNAPSDMFYVGKGFAYYEVLDTIKNELIANDADLKEFGLDINLEKELL